MNRWQMGVFSREMKTIKKEPNENARSKKHSIIEFLQLVYQHSRYSKGKKYCSELENKKEIIQTKMQREKEYKKTEQSTQEL